MATRDMADNHKSHSPIEAEVDATFAEWMGDSSVYWNAERNAWIVTGYAETAKILADASTFWRDIPLREGSPDSGDGICWCSKVATTDACTHFT